MKRILSCVAKERRVTLFQCVFRGCRNTLTLPSWYLMAYLSLSRFSISLKVNVYSQGTYLN